MFPQLINDRNSVARYLPNPCKLFTDEVYYFVLLDKKYHLLSVECDKNNGVLLQGPRKPLALMPQERLVLMCNLSFWLQLL